MTHICKPRPSFNLVARLFGDKWVCKLCGRYLDYDDVKELRGTE